MRILRLDLDSGEELDLHPYVTVLGGLDPGLQRRVADQIARIARGDVEGIGGLIETHDMLIDIHQDRITSLALPADADVLVNAEQLPGASLVVVSSTESAHQVALQDKIAAAEIELTRVISEIAAVNDQLQRDTAELDDARRSLDEFAVTAHEAAVRGAEETEELVRRRLEAGEVATVGPVIDAPLDPLEAERSRLADQLAAERRRLADLEALLDEERLGLLQLLEQLEVEQTELEALRAELDRGPEDDAAPVVEPEPEPEPEPGPILPSRSDMDAVDALIREVAAGPADAPMIPSLPAAALADQVAAHFERQRDFERELVERGSDPEAIRVRLEHARRAEADAAEAARPRTVSPDDEREIERLHDIANDNVDRRDHRRHGKEATRLYEEATEQLEELLGRYGFPTYASFIMGRTAPAIDIDARRHHDDVKAMVASLEQELDDLMRSIDEDPHARMLRAEREQLWSAARDMLGVLPDDLEEALRRHRVPGPVEFDAPDRLRTLLGQLDLDVADASSTGSVLEIADGWLRDAEAAHAEAEAALHAAAAPSAAVEAPEASGDDADAPMTIEDEVAAQERLVADLLARSTRLDSQLTEREAEFDLQAAQVAALEASMVAHDDEMASRRAADEAEREAAVAAEPDPADLIQRQIDNDPTVRAAREQAELTKARLERHHVAVERVDRLHGSIGEVRQRERSLTAHRESLQAERDLLRTEFAKVLDSGAPLAPVAWSLTDEGVGPIEWYLLGRVASLRSVSSAGSVPLVLNDAFRGLPSSEAVTLCEALARIGETVQVIYLGDEPSVIDWAMDQGLDRAAVVRPGQPAF